MDTTLEVTQDLPQAPPDVWPLLTEPDAIAQWLGEADAWCDGALAEGDVIDLRPANGPDPEVQVRVLHLDAPHEAVWMWQPTGREPQLVTIRCLPLPSGRTRVAIRHEGLPIGQPQMSAQVMGLWQNQLPMLSERLNHLMQLAHVR